MSHNTEAKVESKLDPNLMTNFFPQIGMNPMYPFFNPFIQPPPPSKKTIGKYEFSFS